MSEKTSQTWVFAAAVSLAGLILVLDVNLPLGVAGGVPYVAVVLSGLWLGNRRHVLALAVGTTLLTLLGYVYSPEGGILWIVISNRLLAVAVIWITAGLILLASRSQTAVRQSEERFRAISDAAPFALFIARQKDSQWLYGNRMVNELFGFEEDVTAHSDLDFYWDPNERRELLEALEKKDQRLRFEQRFKRADGEMFWGLVSSVSIQFGGEPCVLIGMLDITERKRAEEQLRDSQRLLQTVFDAIPHTLVVKDHECRYIKVNKAYSEMYGLSQKDVYNKTAVEIPGRPEEDRIDVLKEDRMVLEGKEQLMVFEHTRTNKHGEIRSIENIRSQLRDEQGNVSGLLAIAMDITERKRAEEELRESQRLLQTVFDTIPHTLVIKDRECRYLKVNKAFSEMYGFSQEEVFRKTPLELSGRPESDKTETLEEDQLVLNGKDERMKFEKSRTDRHGEIRRIENYRSRLLDEDGHVAGLVTVGMDITDRKRAEEELQASQRLLQAVFDIMPLWVTVKDTQGRFLMVNRSFANAHHINTAEFIGRHLGEFEILRNQQMNLYLDTDGQALRTGGRVDLPEYDVVLPDEETQIRKMTKLPFRDEEGKVAGVVAISEDITGRKRDEESLRKSYQRLKETQYQLIQAGKMAAVGQLAAGIAHEINNPLASISSSSEILLESMATEPAHNGGRSELIDEHLKRISNNVFRCGQIISGMLDFVRQDETELVKVNLFDLLKDALLLVKGNTKATSRQFAFSSIPEAPGESGLDKVIFSRDRANPSAGMEWTVRSRPQQLLQVLLNLLVNAVDATESGGAINLSIERQADGYEVVVQDDGAGIPAEQQEHVFEPFFTTKPVGEGTGLGLYLSHQILSSLGGRLSLESRVGLGTTMRMWLPHSPGEMIHA